MAPALGSYELLQDTSQEAAQLFPGRTEFTDFQAYAELRAGRAEYALSLIDQSSTSALSQTLREEIIQTLAVQLMSADDDARELEQLAGSADDETIAMYAAVRLAENGHFDRALTLFADKPPGEFAFWLYLYSKDYRQALTLLNYMDITLPPGYPAADLETELLYQTGGYGEAANSLADLSERYPETWTYAVNRAYLMSLDGDTQGAIRIIERAYERLPDVTQLKLHLASLLLDSGQIDRAATVAQVADTVDEATDLLRIIETMVRVEKRTISATSSSLWDIYNSYESTAAARLLSVFSFQTGNFSDLSLILSRSSHHAGNEGWHQFFNGIYAASRGDYQHAMTTFSSLAAEHEDWRMYYNASLIATALREYSEALDLLRMAERSIADSPTPETAQIRLAIARILIAQRNYEGAARQIDYAADIVPDSTEVISLLRELEAVMD